MKRKLLAVGAVAILLAFTACENDLVDHRIRADRPGAPRNVTLAPSPCGNWGLLTWRVGSNADGGHSIFKSQTNMNLHESLTPEPLSRFLNPSDARRGAPLPGGTITHLARFSWNDDSTLDWELTNDADLFSAVVRLFHPNNNRDEKSFTVGVRSNAPFDSNFAQPTHLHSPITWAAGGARTFRAYEPRAVLVVEDNITHSA